ncbi:GGDEF domain-containing protein [Blastococcus sp. MG754426]|uniref:GGDEF domain-containing protein n=1 Tax=unclassified Blastococcus TaxID=2619396 RepID=UPI001EF0D688|nr:MULTISPECIES: GGDEF domain-containing protein [unclassified Blastococcus]MCF6506567.1 GGDEF domain-containing protein [Blastococcus sp. MG754426]MCF6510277.1 GGDEF domain-containing protein [Blastococcus sp. MG754427]
MNRTATARLVGGRWPMAALAIGQLVVAAARPGGGPGARTGRGDRPRQRQVPLRLSLPATVALVSLVLEVRHGRAVQRVIAELEHRGHTDALTGLGNRWAFDDDLAGRLSSTATSRRRRCDPEPATLLLVDIDHFKRYNDRHGHPAGDQALVRVAAAIRGVCRRGDGIYRLGGEEFAVLLTADHREAVVVADRIRQAVTSATGGALTVSLGVAGAETDGPQALIARADRGLYEAKSRGRNRISVQVPEATGPGPALETSSPSHA